MLFRSKLQGPQNNQQVKVFYSDADNDNVTIDHNTVTQNGGLDAAGGGIGLHTGKIGRASCRERV